MLLTGCIFEHEFVDTAVSTSHCGILVHPTKRHMVATCWRKPVRSKAQTLTIFWSTGVFIANTEIDVVPPFVLVRSDVVIIVFTQVDIVNRVYGPGIVQIVLST